MRPACLFLLCVVFAVPAVPAVADSACTADNVSNILGTTCDIGNLRFSFTDAAAMYFGNNPSPFAGGNRAYNYDKEDYDHNDEWSSSDFFFTPVTNGFTLTLLSGMQQIVTAPTNGWANNVALLYFVVSGLSGSVITGGDVEGGAVSVSGGLAWAASGDMLVTSTLCPPNCATLRATEYDSTQDGFRHVSSWSGPPLYFESGYGFAAPFWINTVNGSSATWDGPSTTFTFTLAEGVPAEGVPKEVHEPSTFLMLGTGLLGIGGALKRKFLQTCV